MLINIYRTDHSSYLPSNFAAMEKKALEELTDVKYLEHLPPSPAVLITTSYTKLNELKNIDWDQIKLIIHPNSGYDNFSGPWVKKANFPILVGNPLRAQAVASYILSALLQHFAKIPFSLEWDKSRSWNRSLLIEKSVLLIGYGHIGKIVHNSLQGITKKITIIDPFHLSGPDLTNIDLPAVDILIIAASLNPTSKNMIDKNIFSKLSPQITIINAARGEIINEEDLLKFLKNNPTAAAYLDVFTQEPYSAQKFNFLPNLHTSSHIAGVYQSLPDATILFEKKVLSDFIELSCERYQEKYRDLLLKNRLNDDFLI